MTALGVFIPNPSAARSPGSRAGVSSASLAPPRSHRGSHRYQYDHGPSVSQTRLVGRVTGASPVGTRRLRSSVVSHALPPEFKASIDEFVTSNKIVVFMKGNKQMPQCGFSNTVVQILNQLSVPYVTVDILENEMLRAGMKEYSAWPTFPQVYVDGEFYGGCDIVIEGFQNGELAETLEIALNS